MTYHSAIIGMTARPASNGDTSASVSAMPPKVALTMYSQVAERSSSVIRAMTSPSNIAIAIDTRIEPNVVVTPIAMMAATTMAVEPSPQTPSIARKRWNATAISMENTVRLNQSL